MKVGDRIEMQDNSYLGNYWGTVTEVNDHGFALVRWDNYELGNWIWSDSRLNSSDISIANGVIHGS